MKANTALIVLGGVAVLAVLSRMSSAKQTDALPVVQEKIPIQSKAASLIEQARSAGSYDVPVSGDKTTLNEAARLPVEPFTVSEAQTRKLSASEIDRINSFAIANPRNLFIQSVARQAATNREISLNDIKVLSLNPQTAPLAEVLA